MYPYYVCLLLAEPERIQYSAMINVLHLFNVTIKA